METIFAEKLETLISPGAANSRMKDYHDLLLLCRSESKLIDKIWLKDNITQTFQNRRTVFSLPVHFQSDELERHAASLVWAFTCFRCDRVQALGLPEKIDTVINDLNQWLLAIDN